MTGVAVRYKTDLQLFAATLATSKHPNGAFVMLCNQTATPLPIVSMTVLVNEKRFEADGKRTLLPVGQECELLMDRRNTGDERLVVQTPFLTVYVLKYADSPNLDLHIDVEQALGEVRCQVLAVCCTVLCRCMAFWGRRLRGWACRTARARSRATRRGMWRRASLQTTPRSMCFNGAMQIRISTCNRYSVLPFARRQTRSTINARSASSCLVSRRVQPWLLR